MKLWWRRCVRVSRGKNCDGDIVGQVVSRSHEARGKQRDPQFACSSRVDENLPFFRSAFWEANFLWLGTSAGDLVVRSEPVKKDRGVVADQLFFAEAAVGLVPLIDPVDHSQQREGCRPWMDVVLGSQPALHCLDRVFEEVDITPLARVNPLAEPRGECAVLMQNDGDFAVPAAQEHSDVARDARPQPLDGIRDLPHDVQNLLVEDIQSMIHDLEQDFILALEMVVQRSLAQIQGRGNILHRSGLVPALLEKPRGGSENVAPRVGDRRRLHRHPY